MPTEANSKPLAIAVAIVAVILVILMVYGFTGVHQGVASSPGREKAPGYGAPQSNQKTLSSKEPSDQKATSPGYGR